jgi:hypothetical protein
MQSMLVVLVLAAVPEQFDAVRVIDPADDVVAAEAALKRWQTAIDTARDSPKPMYSKSSDVVAVERDLLKSARATLAARQKIRQALAAKDNEPELEAAAKALLAEADSAYKNANHNAGETNLYSTYTAIFTGVEKAQRRSASIQGELYELKASRKEAAAQRAREEANAQRRQKRAQTAAQVTAAVAHLKNTLETLPDEADEATVEAALAEIDALEEQCADAAQFERQYFEVENPTFPGCFEHRDGAVKAALRARLPEAKENEAVSVGSSVLKLFATVHPSRLRFVNRNVGKLRRGEAVVLVNPGQFVDVVSITGERTNLEPTYVSKTRLTPQLPVPKATDLPIQRSIDGTMTLVGSADDEVVDDTPPTARDPGYIQLLDPSSKDFVTLTDGSERFWKCFEPNMKKLDPDGTAWRFTAETYNVRTGQTLKVEKYEEQLRRRVCKMCGCARFNTLRRDIGRKVLAAPRAEELKKALEVLKRIERIAPTK